MFSVLKCYRHLPFRSMLRFAMNGETETMMVFRTIRSSSFIPGATFNATNDMLQSVYIANRSLKVENVTALCIKATLMFLEKNAYYKGILQHCTLNNIIWTPHE